MPHLHLHDPHIDNGDQEGLDLADPTDLAAAQAKALAGIRGLLGHEAMNGEIDLRGRVDIADAAGNILATVQFKDAVTIVGP
jgi:hypothetical protein